MYDKPHQSWVPVTETPTPCPEEGCDGTLRRKWSTKYENWFYGCDRYPECRGAAGCHADGSLLGIPANAETKEERIRTHHLFDQLWKTKKLFSRSGCYAHFAKRMGRSTLHIGELNRDECLQLQALVLTFARQFHVELVIEEG
jgi:ssDNA-binding Zn-finger/Zn-ribbon topoisomerase 1